MPKGTSRRPRRVIYSPEQQAAARARAREAIFQFDASESDIYPGASGQRGTLQQGDQLSVGASTTDQVME